MLKITNLLNKQQIIYLLLGIILLTHVLIISRLIYFPYPELFIYPYLTNHGLKPYSQILDQHFPGLMFLPINLDNLGMNTPEIAKGWSIVIIVLIQIILFYISSQILKSRKKAVLVNLFYLIWQPFFEGWVFWIDSFLPLLLLPAFYCLYKAGLKGNQQNKWILFSGLFLGIGIVFKQVLIPLAGLVLFYIFWKKRSWKAVRIFLLGLFVPIVLMLIYFISIGVLKDFWYWTFIFNLTTYAKMGRGMGPTTAQLTRTALVFGLAIALLFVKKLKTNISQILLIFLFGTLLGFSTRFEFVHFQPVLPFAVLATVYGFGQLSKISRLGVISVYSIVLLWWLAVFYRGHLGDRVISFETNTRNIAAKIKSYTNKGDKIFVYGAPPQLYQMSETLPAGDVFVFQFPWFLKIAEERILTGIINDKPRVVVIDDTIQIEDQKMREYSQKIYQYLMQNYQTVDKVGTTNILLRKD